MRILALQPYDAGSHRAFLSGWRRHSRHAFDVLALPGRHFKWRMRQAPISFAQDIEILASKGKGWDALWCTSMLDLATFRGLCPEVNQLPVAVYFHENQLAYPVRYENQRDLHFGLTNMTTALAAVASNPRAVGPCVWWNSAYNRDSFLGSLAKLIDKMPDERPVGAPDAIRQGSSVFHPGIDYIGSGGGRAAGPPHLVWAARWEHDKQPELFFNALGKLEERGVGFRISVIGERFAEYPKCFDTARDRFAERIVRWGYQKERRDYHKALAEADLVVSTSRHEFFGLAVAEAVSAGCVPVLPEALAYPEVWSDTAVYHDQSPTGVADAIERAIKMSGGETVAQSAQRFAWPSVAAQMDDAIEALVQAER